MDPFPAASRFTTLCALVIVISQCYQRNAHAATNSTLPLNFKDIFTWYLDNQMSGIPAKNPMIVVRSSPNYIVSRFHVWNNTSMTFLISLDYRETNEATSSIFESLKQVATYNRRSVQPIKIWLSLHPRDDAVVDIETVVNMTTVVNQITNETITALLLDYGLLQLTSSSIPLIREDLQICSRKTGSANLRCGLIIDSMNCLMSTDLLTKLGLTPDHILILNQDAFSSFSSELIFHSVTPCIIKLQNTGINIGIVPYNLIIGDDVDILAYRLVNATQKTNLLNISSIKASNEIKTTEYYTIFNVLDFYNLSNVRVYKPIKNQQEWLSVPMEFDKQWFGVSIYAEDTFISKHESVYTPLFLQFRTILIESGIKSGKRITEIVKKIAHAAAQIKFTKKIIPSGNNHFDNSYQTEFFLLMNIWFENFGYNFLVLDDLHSAVAAGNDVYPGAITTVLFNWDVPLRHSNGTFVRAESVLHRYLNQAKALQRLLQYTSVNNNTKIRYGVTWNVEKFDRFIKDSNSTEAQSMLLSYLIDQAKHVNTVFLKLEIQWEVFSWQTLLFSTRSFIYKVTSYMDLLKGPLAKMSANNVTIGVYVGFTACLGASHTNISKTLEFVLFWEKINAWAATKGVLVIMNTAFETGDTKNITKCKLDWFQMAWSDCMCGWWRVSNKSEIASEDSNDGMIWIEDKKSIARRVYAESHPHPPKQEKTTKETPIQVSYNFLQTLLPLGVLIFCVLLGAVTFYLVHHYRSKNILSHRELHRFLLGDRERPEIGTDNDGSVIAQRKRYDSKRHEIKPSSFTIDLNRVLGKGEFSTVYRGAIKKAEEWTEVAVKMKSDQLLHGNQRHGNILALKGLIAEIKILSYVGDHPNIVRLEGAYTAKLRKGTLMVFLELCPNGSLEYFLRSCTPYPNSANEVTGENVETSLILNDANTDGNAKSKYHIGNTLPTQLENDLVKWSQEIACGMEFLARMKLVHADLAARNVLLDATKTAKISDFGLSRRLYEYSEYVKQGQAYLPWRWMAPESLRKLFFSERSDVWSFGVTLWEMYTLGDLPYPGLSYDINFPVLLTGGIRLPKPKYASNRLYEVMKKCWKFYPEERPSFVELQTMLNTAAENTTASVVLD